MQLFSVTYKPKMLRLEESVHEKLKAAAVLSVRLSMTQLANQLLENSLIDFISSNQRASNFVKRK